MRSPHGFLVEPFGDKLYNNTKSFGDVELILSSSMETHKTTNRLAIVDAVPSGYNGPIKDGAIVIVHHNTFRKVNDIRGVEKFSSDLFRDGTYVIYEDSIFGYKNDWNDDWSSYLDWCFIEPVVDSNDIKIKKYNQLHGVVRVSNDILTGIGVSKGDEVVFIPESEYEFDIDDKILYRVDSRDVCLKIQDK